MPWNASDAHDKTKQANTPAKARQWRAVANSVLAKTGDDAQAIRIANAAVKQHPAKPGPPKHWSGH